MHGRIKQLVHCVLLLLLQVDILRDTVMGALTAALPAATQRTIYLCDDLPGVVVLSLRLLGGGVGAGLMRPCCMLCAKLLGSNLGPSLA